MKVLTPLFLYILLSVTVLAQNRGAIILPQVGDLTYYSQVDWNGERSDLELENIRDWPLKSLRPSYIQQSQFLDANDLADVPDGCDMVWNKTQNEGLYFANDEGGLQIIAVKAKTPFTKSGSLIFKVEGKRYMLTKDNFEKSKWTNSYTLKAKLAKEDFSHEFDFLPENTDSLKIDIAQLESNRAKHLGNIELYHIDDQATLVTSLVRSEVTLEIKYKNNPEWFSYTINKLKYPPFFLRYLSRLPIKEYRYYVSNYIFPIVEYKLINEEFKEVFVQDKDNVLKVPSANLLDKKMMAYPNPTFGDINFTLLNYPEGAYRLEVFTITGKKILSKNMTPNPTNTFKVNLDNLSKGIYLYRFIDFKGRRTPTQRILKTTV